MYAFFVVLHVLVCVVLCVVILLQSSKGGGLAGAFGGGGAPQQIFGSRGMTTILHKLTIYCAVAFFITSATLFALTADRNQATGSVVQEAVSEGTLTSDVTPPVPADEALFPSLPGEGEATAEGAAPAGGTSPGETAADEDQQADSE